MHVSLIEFLKTGAFAGILPGTLKAQIVERLGEPDAEGGTSRMYRKPRVLLYGSVEINLDPVTRDQYVNAHWDVFAKGAFQFSRRLSVLDWDWTLGMTREQIEASLTNIGLAFEDLHLEIADRQWLRVESGVIISFDENGLLVAVNSPPD